MATSGASSTLTYQVDFKSMENCSHHGTTLLGTTAATGAGGGHTSYHCDECGEEYRTNETPDLGHVMVGGTLRSTNQAEGASISRTVIAINAESACQLSFAWDLSSEPIYDKFTITLDDAALVDEESGVRSGTVNRNMAAGFHTLALEYSKDSWGDGGSDTATVSNLRIAPHETRDYVVGTGQSYGPQMGPYVPIFNYSTQQIIYEADEIGGAGELGSLSFMVASPLSFQPSEMRIYLGMTESDQFAGADSPFGADDLTLVYSGAPTLGLKTGWEEIVFDTLYDYDGARNLVVVVCRQSETANGALTYRASFVDNRAIARWNSGDGASYMGDIDDGYPFSLMTVRPDIKLDMAGRVYAKGDVNANGAVNVVDAQIAYYIAIQPGAYYALDDHVYEQMFERADVVGADFNVDGVDAWNILNLALMGTLR